MSVNWPGRGIAWLTRLEARVALALGLLITTALAAVFVIATSVVSAQSHDRASVELIVASGSFHNLLRERVRSAMREAELVTQLPVFRAHLTDQRLAEDRATVEAMADGYRAQLDAQFAIVARQDEPWAASPGWPATGRATNARLDRAIAAALSGAPAGAIIAQDDVLYLTVSVPARFADEVLGALTLGYRLTDDLADALARLARCEVVLMSNGRAVATSLISQTSAQAAVTSIAAQATDSSLTLRNVDGRDYLTGIYAIAGPDLGGDAGQLLLLSDWQATQGFIDRLRNRLALTGLVVLSLSLYAGVVFSRRVSRPLRDIASAAAEIAAGNLHLQLPEQGTLESVAVARAFNGMSVSLRHAHDRLTHDATHDPLTRLPNRALFMERLERAVIRRARHPEYLFAVLFVDLDRFKHVNDSLGHAAGDALLMRFAERLAQVVRQDDVVTRLAALSDSEDASTLARFGGDEFVLLLDDITDPIDAVRVAERVQRLTAQPLRAGTQDVFATPSIGIAVCTPAHRTADDLVRDADLAMYRAKKTGGNTYAVADSAMHDVAVQTLLLETELRLALERGELRVRYQPVVSLGDRRVVGFEALVRWEHPERGLLLPGVFLRVADEVGLTTQIDEWVLREACRQGREWLDAKPSTEPPTMSVNLSPKAFGQPTIVSRVAAVLAETGFPARALRLEITESTAIHDPARARTVLAELRALGVRVSIDDFGTGYSSLSYLQMFPFDVLKIDRSFISSLRPGSNENEIVQLIVGLAKTLGLDVVAEGAETEAQVAYLEGLGCGYGQGYFFAVPLEAVEAGRRVGCPPYHGQAHVA